MRLFALISVIVFFGTAPSYADPRIRSVAYSPDKVIRLVGHYGYQTAIEFPAPDRIESVAVGDSLTWQVTPNKRGNVLFVKPVDEGDATNMTVVTTERYYTFELVARRRTPETPASEITYLLRIEPPAAAAATPALFILLFYWTFRRTGSEVYESAELDGASLLQTWWQIALPLARPALLAVGMLAFLFYWNDFINPLLYLRSQTLYTLPVGLLQLQEMDRTNWSLLMAASVLVTVPALIVFALLQRSLLNWDAE